MTLLLGGPGSGKSTLMKVLTGRLKGKNYEVRAHDSASLLGGPGEAGWHGVGRNLTMSSECCWLATSRLWCKQGPALGQAATTLGF